MGCGSSKTTAVDNTSKQTEVKKEEIQEQVEEFKDYETAALNSHNEYRAKHGGPDMTLNRELCDRAQEYAEYLLKHDLFEHSTKSQRKYENSHVGENLGYYMGSNYENYDATSYWYDEIKDYDFNSPGFSSAVGHFTQVVWKDSTQLGVGKAMNPVTKKVLMVGRYYPGGNYVGKFPENVLPPS